MNILITGGLGFLGTNLLFQIISQKKWKSIVVLDSLEYTSNPEILSILNRYPNFKFIRGDVRNFELLKNIIQGKDFIIHLAAQTFVDKSITKGKEFFETNVIGTQTLLEAIRKNRGVKKLIHISTDEVWGEASEKRPFKEEMSYFPRNPYSASKAASDHTVVAYGETYGINYNIVHLVNLVGPWQYPEKFIPKSIVYLLSGKKITIYGTGKNVRTWLHVNDAARGVISTLQRGKPKRRYILGTDIRIANIDLAKKLIKILNLKQKSCLKFVKDRPGHDFMYIVDWSRAKKELGWRPHKTSLNKILRETIAWYKNNPSWWKKRLI